ncbi:MAG: hypothetical protein ABR524_10380, partial [Thermoanaerobaculia bacterium]
RELQQQHHHVADSCRCLSLAPSP